VPVAVHEGGAIPCVRGAAVLGLLRRLAALFRRLGRSPLGGTPARGVSAAGAIAHEPDVASHTTPPRPSQSVPDGAAPKPLTVPCPDDDGDIGIVPAGPVPDVFDETAETAEGSQATPALPSDDLCGQDVAAPVAREAAGMDEGGLAGEGDAVPEVAVETGGAAGGGDGPEPGMRCQADDVSAAPWPGGQTLPGPPSAAETEIGAIGADSSRHFSSDAPPDEMAAETAVGGRAAAPGSSTGQRPPEPSAAPPDGVSALTGDAPNAAPEAVLADEPGSASSLPELTGHCTSGDDAILEATGGCAEEAADAAAPDALGAYDGGTIGAEPVEGPSELGEPDEQREAALDEAAVDGPPEDPSLEPSIFPRADQEPPQPVAPWAEAGEVEEAPLPSGEGLDADVGVNPARGAADVFPVPVDADPGDAEAGARSAISDEHAADAGPAGTALPDAIAAAVRRRPGEYRPRLNRARTRRAPGAATSADGDIQRLGADLQILVGAADWGVELSALLRVPAGAAEEVAVEHGGVETWLGQLDDELLEPLALADAKAAFGEPLLVTAVNLPVRWSRTSRDLHVFGPDHRVAGFVSQARIVIGQENVVICREGLASAARAQILATGSAEPVGIEGPNVPAGWVCWRGVRPGRPSLPVGGESILDALDPLPAVSIGFSGGIQLSRGVWLEGHPPSVRLLGLLSEGDPVLIDRRPAALNGDGAWTVQGWDAPGAHTVDHGGKSAGYAIEAGAGAWDWWPAWEGATQLAGALSEAEGREYFCPAGSAALLGARPGQICVFTPSTSGIGVARPGFEPVWLLTAGSGMRRGSASMIGSAPPPGTPVGSPAAVERWIRAICSSGKAGAELSAERAAWNRYVAAARSQRKRRR
jgi:hypothetical protein